MAIGKVQLVIMANDVLDFHFLGLRFGHFLSVIDRDFFNDRVFTCTR